LKLAHLPPASASLGQNIQGPPHLRLPTSQLFFLVISSYISLLTNDFYQHPFSSFAIKLSIEDLLPRAEIKIALRDCHNDFASHDLTFHMRVGIIFTSIIMTVLIYSFGRSKFLQPLFVILM